MLCFQNSLGLTWTNVTLNIKLFMNLCCNYKLFDAYSGWIVTFLDLVRAAPRWKATTEQQEGLAASFPVFPSFFCITVSL